MVDVGVGIAVRIREIAASIFAEVKVGSGDMPGDIRHRLSLWVNQDEVADPAHCQALSHETAAGTQPDNADLLAFETGKGSAPIRPATLSHILTSPEMKDALIGVSM